ncbi:hypothetical protein [Microcystis aeruginosa]|uniref:Uncharacterized protein n=1 Tax=Microcystis aeruginosa PCC 9443 TaxID=1160281 RepID=I4G653_MICAE|nr:hypothetical protein [Microcystis aeruginosa]CCI03414.1 hypothetical protein MICAC_4590003 [Microcystis aeruginosa PCC 9443]
MPLADTLNRNPGDILKSDDWNVIIKEIDRLETAKINRDGADTLKGQLTIAEALNANSNVTIKGSLSIVVPQPQEPSGQILVLGPTNASNLRLGYHQDYSWIQSHGSKPLLINRLGNNIGIGSTINPVARLDIASATRTGTHPTAVKGLYITGDFNADNDGVEFRHSNGTQGIGFGFNTIYAAGSEANQDLGLKPKGTGEVKVAGSLSVSGIVKAQALTVSGDLSVTGSVSFGSQVRQMLNLWSTNYGIGIQSSTQYFRSDANFAWYKGGSHNDAELNAGGGTSLMTLDANGKLSVSGDLSVTGSVNFSLQTRQMLNLWSNGYGIGIQSSTQYFRSGANFAWYRGGSHNDAELNAGGGTSLMTLDRNGNLSVSGIVKTGIVKIGSLQLGGFTFEDKDEWPNVVWYRNTDQNWDEGLIKHSSSRGVFGKAGFGIHFHQNREFGFWSTGWNPLFAVEGDTGNTYIRGNLDLQGSAFLGYESDISNFGTPLKSGFYQNGGREIPVDVPDTSHPWTHLITARHSNINNNHQLQIASTFTNNDRLFFRKVQAGLETNNPGWNEVATRGGNTFVGNQIINVGNLTITNNSNTFRISVEGNRVVFYLSNAVHGTNKQISWDGDNNWDQVS